MNWLKKIFSNRTSQDVTPSERHAVWIMAIVLAAFSLVPAATGYIISAQKNQAWTGVNAYATSDTEVYLSNIDQIKRGHWLISNQFTSEPSYPYLSPVWLIIGLMARLGGLDPLIAMIVGRFLAVLFLVWAAHWSIRQFMRSRAERLTALGLFFFGSGVGCLIDRIGRDQMSIPIDQWVTEAFVISSSLTTPHLILSWAMLLVIFALMFRAYRDGQLRDAIYAGLLYCILILFHPYHAPTIYFVCGLALVTMSLVDLKLFWRRVRAFIILCLLSIPSVAYHWWLLRPERNGPHAFSGNVCWTPTLIYVLIGFGAFIPLAIAGGVLWRRRQITEERLPGLFLATWIIGQFMVIYAPTMLQRRFIQGLLFPLALFSGVAMVWIWQWISRQPKKKIMYYRLGLVILALLTFLRTPVKMAVDDVFMMKNDNLGIYTITPDETAMFDWMRTSLPEGAVVASNYWTGDFLPPRTTARAYFGHWGQTIDLTRKTAEMETLYGEKLDLNWARELLAREKISYVYYGKSEKLHVPSFDQFPFLEEAHREGDEILYRVRLDK